MSICIRANSSLSLVSIQDGVSVLKCPYSLLRCHVNSVPLPCRQSVACVDVFPKFLPMWSFSAKWAARPHCWSVLVFVRFSSSVRLCLTRQWRLYCGVGCICSGSKRKSCSSPRNCCDRLLQVRAASLKSSEIDGHSMGMCTDSLEAVQLYCFRCDSDDGLPDFCSSKPRRTVTAHPPGFPITA